MIMMMMTMILIQLASYDCLSLHSTQRSYLCCVHLSPVLRRYFAPVSINSAHTPTSIPGVLVLPNHGAIVAIHTAV